MAERSDRVSLKLRLAALVIVPIIALGLGFAVFQGVPFLLELYRETNLTPPTLLEQLSTRTMLIMIGLGVLLALHGVIVFGTKPSLFRVLVPMSVLLFFALGIAFIFIFFSAYIGVLSGLADG